MPNNRKQSSSTNYADVFYFQSLQMLVLEVMFSPGSLVSSPQRQVTFASKVAILLYAVVKVPL